jgi:hypothetical protein
MEPKEILAGLEIKRVTMALLSMLQTHRNAILGAQNLFEGVDRPGGGQGALNRNYEALLQLARLKAQILVLDKTFSRNMDQIEVSINAIQELLTSR